MVDVKGILGSFDPNHTTVAQLTMAHLLQLAVSCSTFKACRATWDTSRKLHLWFGNYSRNKKKCVLSCNYERSTERNLLLIQVSRLLSQSPHIFRQGSCSGWKDSGLGTQRFQTPGSLLPWSILRWGFMICILRGLSLFPVIYLVNKYLGFMIYDGHHLQGMVLDWCWPITLQGRITYPHLLGKGKASSKVRFC